jgi:hypothetical protein
MVNPHMRVDMTNAPSVIWPWMVKTLCETLGHAEVAALLDIDGPTVRRLENGELPRGHVRDRICKAFAAALGED